MGKAAKILKISNLRRAYLYCRKNGLKNTWYAAAERMYGRYNDCYEYTPPSEGQIEEQKKQAEKLGAEASVCFSILVPAYETKREYLLALLHSVREQTYPYWQLVLADASRTDTVERTVREFMDKHSGTTGRLHYMRLADNQGISGNSNAALAALEGSYTGFLDHDDLLAPDALFEMACAVRMSREEGKEPVLLYTDEDKTDESGSRFYEPHYKEKFNYDLLLTNNYICHFMAVRTDILKELKLRPAYDGAQDYDLVLRCVDRVRRMERLGEPAGIVHIPRILYHWRCHSGSTADNPASKMYAYEAGRKAVSDYCREKGYHVFLHHEKHLGFYSAEYQKGLFRVRQDIGAAGGRIIKDRKIYAGAYREDGTVLYEGLNCNFSGYMHRAALRQDVDAVDIRCIRVRRECLPLLEAACAQELGEGHAVMGGIRRAIRGMGGAGSPETEDAVSQTILAGCRTGLISEEQVRRISLLAGKRIREEGYLILWDPALEIVL